MAYAGLVKKAKSHFENCNNGPEETPVQGDCSYILTPRTRRPRGPNVKKTPKNSNTFCTLLILRKVVHKGAVCHTALSGPFVYFTGGECIVLWAGEYLQGATYHYHGVRAFWIMEVQFGSCGYIRILLVSK